MQKIVTLWGYVMLGRMVLPIIFYEDGKEIAVTEISHLKKYYNDKYLPELIEAVRTIRLEQFFFGLGKDEIRDLIVGLKQQGVSEIEILNQVADIIGVERLKEVYTKIYHSFDDVFTDKCDECELVKYRISVNIKSVNVSGSKKVYGVKGNEVVLDDDLIVSVKGNSKLSFNNLFFKAVRNNTVLTLNVEKNSEVFFERCKFIGISIVVEGGPAKFHECEFNEASTGLKAKNSNVFLKNCIVSQNKENGISLENSEFTIENCEVYSNGNENNRYQQISVKLSKGQIKESAIHRGINAAGISCTENSKINISNCKVFENFDNGVVIKNSEFTIENCEIHSNGNENDDYPQISVESSEGQITGSSVYKGVNATGIYCTENSDITIQNCKVFKNFYNGISVNDSCFDIENCEIYLNGNKENYYPQVWVELSKGQIAWSVVYKGINATGIHVKSSNLKLVEVKTWENTRSVYEDYCSYVKQINCEFK